MTKKMRNEIEAMELDGLKQALAAGKARLETDANDAEAKEVIELVSDLLAERDKAGGAKVRVRAKCWCSVDGVSFSKGQEGMITEKQYHAVSRHFEKIGMVLALLGVLLLGSVASAQQYVFQALSLTNGTYFDGGTNNVKGAAAGSSVTEDLTTSTWMARPISVTKYADFALAITFTNDNPNATSNVLFKADWSLDGTNWQTYGQFSAAAAGATTVVVLTNINMYSIGYFRMNSIVNTNGGAVTNLTIKFGTKPRRLGAITPGMEWRVASAEGVERRETLYHRRLS